VVKYDGPYNQIHIASDRPRTQKLESSKNKAWSTCT